VRHYRPAAGAATAPDSSTTIFVPAEDIAQTNPHVRALVDSVMQSLSSARQQEVQAWEEELLPCEHTLTLAQLTTGHIPASGTCALRVPFLRLKLKFAGWAMVYRAGTLFEMRPQGEPLALPHLWCARLWAQALRRNRRERPRDGPFRRNRTSGLRQTWNYHARRQRR
jgi:hypothetical protein